LRLAASLNTLRNQVEDVTFPSRWFRNTIRFWLGHIGRSALLSDTGGGKPQNKDPPQPAFLDHREPQNKTLLNRRSFIF
jgi:hypothetical protein